MAKWKNIALISTIVAPIAFGVGDAFAQANRPTNDSDGTTVVLHKRETQGEGIPGKDDENLYWGDGNLDESTAFSNWTWEAGVTFTAYNMGKVISLDKSGKPEIKDTQVPGAPTGLTWDDILEPVEGSSAKFQQGNSDDKNQYAIEFVGADDFDATDLRNALNSVSDVEKVPFEATNDQGETTNDLHNGNWIIIEDVTTGTFPSDATETFATPMVLSLPMLNAQKEGKTDWFGTQSDSYLHLYPKNYWDKGDLTVVKVDGDDNTQNVAGATLALMQLDEAGVKGLSYAIDNGLLNQNLTDIKAGVEKYALSGSVKYDVIKDAEKGVTFKDLVPGQTYYVLEIAAPSGYLPNGKLQKATLNPASEVTGDTTIGGDQDTTVDHKGGTYKLANYDKPDLDKDINVLKPAAVEDLTVKKSDKAGDEDPVYHNSNALAYQNYDFQDNDTLYGVSRGKAFNYTIDLETNSDLGTYKTFGITDNIPYQVNINSWTLYGRFGYGGVTTLGNGNEGLVPLIQAVDPNGDTPDHSTTDGMHQVSKKYNSKNTREMGVSFKFYNLEAAKAFGYEGSFVEQPKAGEDDTAYRNSLTEQTNWIATHLIHMYGFNGQYSFDEKNQAVQFDATDEDKKLLNGEMNIDFSQEFLEKYSKLANFTSVTEKGISSSMVFKMNAQTNSAAQANVGGDNKDVKEGVTPQTDMINNFVTFKYNNGFVSGTMNDQSQTNAVGWEFQKTDSKGNPVSGAGFDLGRLVTEQNVENVISQLISINNNGNAVYDDTKVRMADKLGYTGSRQDKIAEIENYLAGQAAELRNAVKGGKETFVWFIHLAAKGEEGTDKNKQPIIDAMDSHMEMGDIYWVTDDRLATTHLSGVDRGYFQYCGVADGNYVLKESITPKGYKTMDELKFTIGAKNSFYVDENGESKNPEYPTVTSAGDNQQMPSDNQITGRVGDDATAADNWASIKNYKKSVLPVVGGVGALSLLFIGAIAMIASYIKRKTDMREN
ncbi:SpaA isopeptide-forming pilin-related protein [Weissella confusa]|uniref:SpaA isopeptide-forming pilin-related protein n=1 Tax=Weissella confusa TaxID=1583 RepID=UPI0018F1AFFA|nr:SpaA isopeptide-forming pilin-related protein [Weissella confusa]MBJ7685618.1 hypothetical protein [Weissella confusa]MBJ7695895.1 hypothetical protein [Weissella confusa]